MERGYLALVVTLHHRLPGVGQAVGADWASASADSYWPLLLAIDEAGEKGHAEVLTLAISPSWTALASDPAAQALTRMELDRRVHATANEPWGDYWREIHRFAVDRWKLDAIAALRQAADSGAVELIPMPASWTWLPSMRSSSLLLRAQVGLSAADHQRTFGLKPQGLWPPLMAAPVGFDRVLAEYGLRFYAADAYAFRRGTVEPPSDVLGPLITSSGVAVFGVDRHASQWINGAFRYANDPRYADPALAKTALMDHADDFLRRWISESEVLNRRRPHHEPPPLSIQEVSASDLGGSWVFGAQWLALVLDHLGSQPHSGWEPLSLSRYLDRFPNGPLGRPGNGIAHWWIDRPVASILAERCRVAADALSDALTQRHTLTSRGNRSLAQMIRSLLLAHSCDWEAPPGFALSPQQGLSRGEARFDQFVELSASLASGRISSERLALLESGPAYLPEIDFRLLDSALRM